MAVRAVTAQVQRHGLVLGDPAPDSDARGFDAWRDDLAVPDPYDPDFEPQYSHGLVLPPETVAAPLAATPASPAHPAGRLMTADAPEPVLSPARGLAVPDTY